jgi:uncharacterized protein
VAKVIRVEVPRAVRPNVLSTLDAIHVASAMSVRDDLTALVSYDKRMLAAAQDAGLPTASPS